ncbi:MAG: thioredoxin domain-containing protein, partial [Acidobacteriota bacterium]|nr:thioredoxin domain-containing protein [Acidobacteriota bacterium]
MNKPKFTNHLINETSPYLLQHAHNPVDWFAWGEEAFAKAKAEDKPILISIGYSACHWCHVMEHESFEDEATARIMNENFVNIKIDLEERPDVDQIYMTFVQMTMGSGGYPLNVFLTPDRLPFYGGTYFPPVNRYNMPSFQHVLLSIADAYENKRDELLNSANEILGEMRNVGSAEFEANNLSLDQLDSAFLSFTRSFDSVNGGFGGAPKFPPPMSLEFLLRYFYRTKDVNALEMVEKTCTKMAHGGIYDQLGGGFHRYTVDAIWLTPHFEKMLYDNAQLARIYLHLFQITKDEFYKRIAVETLDYVKREMHNERGGFYTAQDADSEGVEGKFFVWTPEEIAEILGENDTRIFSFYYDVTEHGNFEEKNILNVRGSLETSA